ncbi:LMBR1-like membrane protein-domain-containing protein [Blyttiomyces helicus]|uniref:LMBR1-like membrane protein-domain-containing protein n=1 Tax=Blyttiomyces helicus TaxID=388810 RepID=A0A4P9WJC1_9FUNG|nr:LMBR1-like membrane protein-domain-containing protein [Blyttiomyces helicus]|eukprot:RKO93019.1 LMBR1-like membrane protein-domain-containing protein [Blyttiomyces helicus]
MSSGILIATSAVFGLLVIVAAIYFVVYFQHPDDKWVAWFPKVVVIIGLTLACYNVFLLPLDVANQSGSLVAKGSIPMTKLNLAFYIITIIICIVGVPFTVLFYEGADESDSDDDGRSSGSALGYAIKWMVPIALFSGGIITVCYWFLGYANVATIKITSQLIQSGSQSISIDYCAPVAGGPTIPVGICTYASGHVYVSVSPLVYIVAVVSFVGWIVFAVFGGVGLVSLPMDLVQSFIHRPKRITALQYQERKTFVGQQAQLLMEAGKTLQEELKDMRRSGNTGRRYRTVKNRENEFRKDVLILEYHYRRLEDSYKNQGGNFLWQIAQLIGGCVGSVLSLVWIIHICVYLIPVELQVSPLSLFLNSFFISVNSVPFLGTAFYAMFAFYLLGCVVKGNAKLGMRLFFVTLHPMKIGETLMSSLVFNMGIILLCSLSVSQFCTLAFSRFAAYTANAAIFGVQIQNINGLEYGYDILIFALLGFALFTAIGYLYSPYKKQRENLLPFQ